MPLLLMAAAIYEPLKYLLPVSALAAFAVLCMAAWGLAPPWKKERRG
ncbi:MAG: hypothetical protein QGF09_05340 [Rhodospirillales bacterium]|nr:hypothetical protein [Rhodospirillales bacterium]